MTLYTAAIGMTATKAEFFSKPDTDGTPVEISIPSLGLQAAVETVGKNKKGEMAVPEDSGKVGWYNLGREPGENGAAILAGHIDNLFGGDGVFSELGVLKKGDIILVRNKSGEELKFSVTEKEIYSLEAAPLKKIFATESESAHLHLITCAGYFDIRKGTYTKRLVVYAELV